MRERGGVELRVWGRVQAEDGIRDIGVSCFFFFFFQAEDGIRDDLVTGVQTCALPILADEVGVARPLDEALFPGSHIFRLTA